jgi:uncharacterized repeat protein (TIGR01451 family)
MLVALVALASAAAAQAATINVTTFGDPTGAGDCLSGDTSCSLRQAINAENATTSGGDTINLGSGTYTLTQGTDLDITKSLTLQGAGVGSTTVDGSQNSGTNQFGELGRILRVDGEAGVAIEGLTFSGGDDGTDENFCGGCATIALNGGGALFNASGDVTLQNVAFTNDRSFLGGAVSNDSTLVMQDVSFTSDGGGIGGALFSRSGTITATGVTFESDATSPTDEAAVYLLGGNVTLTNTTVADSGGASERGGGIHNAGANLTLTNDTLAGNIRGSLETDRGALTSVANTIIANGFSDGDGDCIASGYTDDANNGTSGKAITNDLGGNLDQDNSCGLLSDSGDLPGVDPKLASIADNTGPTHTQALLYGSPAFGAANESYCPATDQRGVTRANPCDIGAFEAQFIGQPSATTEAAQNVQQSLADLEAQVNFAGEAGGIHFIWGTSPDGLTNTTGETGEGEISSPTPETQTLDGLTAGTTYYYAAVADNATGTAAGSTMQFTTPAGPPLLSNIGLGSVTDTTATVDFSIDPQGADTTYVVKYGTDGLTQQTDPVDIGSTPGPQNLSATLSNLTPDTTYYYEVVATNSEAPDGINSDEYNLTTDQQVNGTAGSPVTLTDSGTSYACPSQATIDWGDGGPNSQGQISCSSGPNDQIDYQATATHVYAQAGDYEIQVSYPDLDSTDVQYAHIAAGTLNTPAVSQSPVLAGFYPSDPNSPDPGSFFTDWQGGSPLWTQTFPIINFNDDPSQDPPGFCPAPNGDGTRPFTDGASLNPPTNTNCSYIVAQNADATQKAGVDTSSNPNGANLIQFTSVMTGSYTVDGPGQVTFNGFSDDGFSFGIGPNAANQQPVYTSGSNDLPSTKTALDNYDIVGSDEGPHAPFGDTFTVYFPAAGTYPFELDYDECCQQTLEMTLTVGNTVLQSPTLNTTVTADSATVAAGDQDGYSITITNPTPSAATLGDVKDTLPSGFGYVPGSTTGATSSDPNVSGQTLTWTGPIAVPANGSVSLHFNVTTPSTAGGPFYDDATGDPTGDHALTPSGDTAPITLTASSSSQSSGNTSPSPTPNPPTVTGGAPTSLTINSTALSGTVNPEGSPTQAYFEYGLDLSQRGPGASSTLYDQSTPPQSVGSDSTNHTVSASLTGLIPGGRYHVRLVASNSAGTTFGPDQTFTATAAAPPPPPVLGKSQNIKPVSGTVFIRTPNGQFIPLTGAIQVGSGAVIDALHGSLQVLAAIGKGKTEQGVFGGAIFKLTQQRTGREKGLVTLSIVEGAFQGAPSYALCTKHKATDGSAASLSSRTLQLLHASAHGKFRTSGRYSAATVRGTIWTVADRCDGTLTHDVTDSVAVNDFVRHKTIILHAGQTYVALAPGRRK